MRDEVLKTNKWEFDEEVTQCFDDMLSRSIPDYCNMRDLVYRIGRHYIQQKTSIVDMGCSTGEAIGEFIRTYGANNSYKLYDVSDPMLSKCKEKYKGWIDNGIVEVNKNDLREGIPEYISASLVISNLTLQFTPIEYRQKIVDSVYKALNTDGAFILVEKVLGSSYRIDNVLIDEYYNIKRDNLYTEEQISAKRKSLEGVLVPITSDWNYQLLKSSGFKEIDCFWRYLNFAGWIAVK